MQIALLSLASIWAMYFTLLSILVMPGTKGTWTKRPETLSFWVFLTRPLLQVRLHPVSCDHSQIESSLGTLRWREPQPPEITAGIKMADTQPCTYWLSATVGRVSFSQVRSENTVGVVLFIHEILVSSHCLPAREVCLLLFGFMGPWSSWFSPKWEYWKLLSGGYFTGSGCMYNGHDLMLQAGGEAIVVVIQVSSDSPVAKAFMTEALWTPDSEWNFK